MEAIVVKILTLLLDNVLIFNYYSGEQGLLLAIVIIFIVPVIDTFLVNCVTP